MKKLLFVSFCFLAILGCKPIIVKVVPTIISVTTTPPVVTSTTITVSGNITDDGGDAILDRGVVYGLNPNPTITDGKLSSGTGIGTFNSTINGLTPGKTYYVRTYATNGQGTAYGDQITVTTTAILASITTTAATAVTTNSATSGGSIASDGGSAITARGVCWSTAQNPTTALTTKTTDAGTTGSFTSSITGLTPGTTYYVKAYTTNGVGTSYGAEFSFKTAVGAAVITTTAASLITSGTITTGGNITADGGGAITARGVCWSTSTGPTIAMTTKTSNGTGTGSFISSITGLATNTLYYIRAYATNSGGTSYGNEVTANTLSQDIKNIVPDNILTIISNLGMPMFTGKTPPQISNFYKLSPNAMTNSNISGDYAIGTIFFPVNLHFYNQDNTLLTIKMDYVEIGTGGGSGSGKEAFLSGSGNNFSVFVKVNYTASGQTCDMITIYSGTITSTGIKDLYYALFMVDDHGDPGNLWISNGQGRVFYDSDGMGSIIQSLSSQNFGINLGTLATPASITIKGQ